MNALKINFQLLHRGRALAWLAGALTVSSTPAAITVSPPPDTGAAPAAATTNVSPRAISLAEAVTPLRLTLELHDGSRVIGVPTVTNLQVRSSFGAIGIDLIRLQTLQFVEGKGTAEFLLQNGDKVSGVLHLETLEMKTSFGPVKIPVAVIRRLSVNPGGKSRGGLVLHYGFDQDENHIVRDKSGQGHDGKLIGAQWTALGKKDGGVVISGGVEEIVAANTKQMFLEDFSLSIWLKRSNPSATSDGGYRSRIIIIDKLILFGAEADGRLYASGADNHHHPMIAKIADLQWHHIDMVKKGKIVSFYLDGEPVGAMEAIEAGDFRQGLSIGGSKDGYPFVGTFDELMIFDRPWSAEEVKQMANPNP